MARFPLADLHEHVDYKRGNYGAFVGLRYLPSLTDLNDGSTSLVWERGMFRRPTPSVRSSSGSPVRRSRSV